MTSRYGLVADLRAEVVVPRGGILSRTLHEDDAVTLTVFAFDAGQELTEHTSSRSAVIEVLEGEAELVVDGEHHDARAGTWVAMAPGTPHSIRATSQLVMTLLLLR
jgi:quercetin dioxygenase-like cupin family protein